MAEPTLNEKIEGTREILSALEARCDERNRELAAALTKHKADLEAASGDARLALEALESDIARLTAERDEIQGSITAAQTALDTQKMDLAQREQRLREGQENLSKDQDEVVAKIHDIGRREGRIAEASKILDDARQVIDGLHSEAEAKRAAAAADRHESGVNLEQTKLILADAKKQKAQADDAAKLILAEANARLAEAQGIKETADQAFKTAEASIASADAKAAEYKKLLDESKAFADANSKRAGELTIWEAALRATARRIQEDKAKLEVAQREFLKQTNGGK